MKTALAAPPSFAYTPSHAAGASLGVAKRRGGRVVEGARLESV